MACRQMRGLVAWAVVLGTAGPLAAQSPSRLPPPPPPVSSAPGTAGRTYYFQKPADPPPPPAAATAPRPRAEPPPRPPAPAPQTPTPPPAPVNPDRYTSIPPRELVFQLPNDANLERLILDRLREEEANRPPDSEGRRPNPYDKYPKDLTFPKSSVVGGGRPYQPKTLSYPPLRARYEAPYVVHRRLHFEDRNTERAGWDLGIVQPVVSTLLFYKDVLAWPQSLASGCAYGFWDTSAGKCLPGSPTPYYLYPPGLTISGGLFEAGIIVGSAFAFP